MTEIQARQKAVDTAKAWLGAAQGFEKHKEIIDTYNKFSPLPRGYKVTYLDAWCATYVSAVAMMLGWTDIIPPECSCGHMVDLFRKHPLSRWEESDSYVPQIGDIVMYWWADGANYATTDATGWPDHVGIVSEVSGNSLTVIEGNYSRSVKERKIEVNGRYIRGYCLPAYWSKAEMETEREQETGSDPKGGAVRYNSLGELPAWALPTIKGLCDAGMLLGSGKTDNDGYPIDLDLSRDMVRLLVILGRKDK
ncbi:MAG: CHAP domain-containing protein [Oscillospiraceae bacterium]|nr:CHAP domain-containing protein [Oscillospiraceae bacterium]